MSPRRWTYAALRLAAVVMVLVASVLGFVQVSQRVFRVRAERLLADVHDLRPGRGDWAGFLRVKERWGKWSTTAGQPCSEQRCEYQIQINDWALGVFGRAIQTPATSEAVLSSHLFRMLHANFPLVRIDIDIRAGRVTGLRQAVETEVPPGKGPGWMGPEPQPSGYTTYESGDYVLTAQTVSEGGLGTITAMPEDQVHPHYRLLRPSGCEGCMGFVAEYQEAASEAEYDFLSGFDLACMTRWSPCVDESDLLPEPWKQYRREHPGRSEW